MDLFIILRLSQELGCTHTRVRQCLKDLFAYVKQTKKETDEQGEQNKTQSSRISRLVALFVFIIPLSMKGWREKTKQRLWDETAWNP